MEYQNKFKKRNLNKSGLLGRMRPTAELPTRETESSPTRPSLHGCFCPLGKTGEGIPPPDTGGSLVKSGRPMAGAGELIAMAQAREEEEPNLGLCTEGSSSGWARGGGELGGKKSVTSQPLRTWRSLLPIAT
jgi:hypothetical protein